VNQIVKVNRVSGPAKSTVRRYGLAIVSVSGRSMHITCVHMRPSASNFWLICSICNRNHVLICRTAPSVLASVRSSLVRDYIFEPNASVGPGLLFDLVFLIFPSLMTRVPRVQYQLQLSVAERTAELTQLNDNLKREIAERNQAKYLPGRSQVLPDAILIIETDYK